MRGISMDTCGRKVEKEKLSRMVRKEWENMTQNKHMFDAEHPKNAKSISHEQMMHIARNKSLHELACPPASTGEAEWDDS